MGSEEAVVIVSNIVSISAISNVVVSDLVSVILVSSVTVADFVTIVSVSMVSGPNLKNKHFEVFGWHDVLLKLL